MKQIVKYAGGLCVLVWMSLAQTAALNESNTASLQALLDSAAGESGVAGAQLSVIVGDQRADLVYGTANAELDIPMTVDTVIQIGSTTKIFNAAVVMSLVEEEKLALDKPIGLYLPELRVRDQQALGAINLRRLLSMSAGLDNGPYTRHGGGEDALAKYVASLAELPQAYTPGEGFGYSNAGTTIAGYAAEVAAGESWDLLLKKRILEPLGLSNAVTLAQELPYHRVSVGHMPAKDGKPPTVIRPWYIQQAQGPAGSTMAMSAQNLVDFGRMFLDGGKNRDGEEVLTGETISTMMSPVTEVPAKSLAEAWGVGPFMQLWGESAVWGHPGGNQSGTSILIWLPDQKGVIAVINNTPSVGDFLNKVLAGVAEQIFDLPIPRLTAPEQPVVVGDLSRYVGRYQSLSVDYEISSDGAGLHVVATATGPDGKPMTMAEGNLVSLGNDRFMLPAEEGDGGNEIAFSGEDVEGRATSLVAPVFAAGRVYE